ncbi:MAG: response regulator [Lachnospiraceae bacterium]|nr:response regulator [Lachnospiraceae bacterium]
MMARVMVVDDAAFVRLTLRNILEKDGHQVVCEAENGIDAVNKYKEFKPDIVTLDITMPETNGIFALKGIKEIDPKAICVMCSAMGQQALVVEAMENGARDFIVKPFQPERVLESIRKALG